MTKHTGYCLFLCSDVCVLVFALRSALFSLNSALSITECRECKKPKVRITTEDTRTLSKFDCSRLPEFLVAHFDSVLAPFFIIIIILIFMPVNLGLLLSQQNFLSLFSKQGRQYCSFLSREEKSGPSDSSSCRLQSLRQFDYSWELDEKRMQLIFFSFFFFLPYQEFKDRRQLSPFFFFLYN